jgi:aldehyde:ferredoxin oxidoreductase
MESKLKGYAGYQLRVDLTGQTTKTEPVPEDLVRKYLGGAGYSSRIIYDETKPGVDPLGPENMLILATGPLSLNKIPGGGSVQICFKSPATNIWAESRSGGNFGPDLKRSGFDFVIITGKAEKPVYIYIKDKKVEFRDASFLLGKLVSDKVEAIKKDTEDEKCSVLCIGPAGEKLVKVSSIMVNERAAGRTGGGAVFGSKNLIAVVVSGTHVVEEAAPDQLKAVIRNAFNDLRQNPFYTGFNEAGTIGDIPNNDDVGDWPTKNWRSNNWGKGVELYDHYVENNFIEPYPCYRGCSIACGRSVQVKDGPFKTPVHGGAEYESISCFTAYVLNENMDAAIHSTYLCNEYGVDTISTGAMIAFAMECFEKGLFTKEQLGDLDLTWGNAEVLPRMVKMIALREGIGDILAEGVRQAAKTIGQGAEEFAIHVKGLEGPAHDPRSGKALGVTYATGSRGMCHIQPLEGMAYDSGKLDWGLIKYGLKDPNEVDRWDEEGKGIAVKLLQDGLTLPDILGTCKFYSYAGMTVDHWADMVGALTGWEMDGKELLKIGERVINLQRLYNIREGITQEDDYLPKRIRTMPEFGKYANEPKCVFKDFDAIKKEYYIARGWDPFTGVPKPEKLAELELA